MCTLKEIILKLDGVLYPFVKSNIWQVCKKQSRTGYCVRTEEQKKWRHQFVKVGNLTKFKQIHVFTRCHLCFAPLDAVNGFFGALHHPL